MGQLPIIVNSNRLSVEIAYPGTVYRGTRFDWTGFITQVTLDGQHTFCVPESYKPGEGTGGIGICNEFGIDSPVGYKDAMPGGSFPKIGIGLLKRPDQEEYNFFRTYEIQQSYPTEVHAESDQVTFDIHPLDCRGYAVRLAKTIKVIDNSMTVHYKLQNVGDKTIETNEYAHNFIGINQQRIGSDYRLRFPYRVELVNMAPSYRQMAPAFLRTVLPGRLLDLFVGNQINKRLKVLAIEGEEIGFRYTPTTAFYCRPTGFSKTDKPQWELTQFASGVGMREIDDFLPWRVALWGVEHVVSTEVFLDIHLQPGAELEWTRWYEFFNLKA